MRLRIVNGTGYNSRFNCSGPRSIRMPGCIYKVTNPKIRLMHGVYKLPNNPELYELVADNRSERVTSEQLAVMGFAVFKEDECVACCVRQSCMLYMACSHLCLCEACSHQVGLKCPLCRVDSGEVCVVDWNRKNERICRER